MALFTDASGQLVVRAAAIGGDTAVSNPSTSNLVDMAPWLRDRDTAVSGAANFHPAQYYSGSAEDPSGVWIAGNLCTNSQFEINVGSTAFAGWGISLGANSFLGRDLAGWFPSGGHAGWVDQNDGVTTTVTRIAQDIPVQPGEWVEFSVYTGALRCTVNMYASFWDSTGTIIGTETIYDTNATTHNGGTSLTNFKRLWMKVQAPANTAYFHFGLQKNGTLSGASPSTSWAFYANAYVGRALQNQLTPAAYQGPGVVIPDLYVKTLHIGDNQVTLPESAYSSSVQTVSTAVATFQSLSITQIAFSSNRLIIYSFHAKIGSAAPFNTLTWYLKKNGTTVDTWAERLNPTGLIGDMASISNVYKYSASTNASDTFTLDMQTSTTNGVTVQDVSIISMQTLK